jgi:hypothetical protein
VSNRLLPGRMQEDQSLKSDDVCDNEHGDASNDLSLFDMGWHSSAGNSFYEAEERFLSFICCPSTLSLNVKSKYVIVAC